MLIIEILVYILKSIKSAIDFVLFKYSIVNFLKGNKRFFETISFIFINNKINDNIFLYYFSLNINN